MNPKATQPQFAPRYPKHVGGSIKETPSRTQPIQVFGNSFGVKT